MTWSDEDFIGRVARVSRRCHAATTAQRTLARCLGLYRRQWISVFGSMYKHAPEETMENVWNFHLWPIHRDSFNKILDINFRVSWSNLVPWELGSPTARWKDLGTAVQLWVAGQDLIISRHMINHTSQNGYFFWKRLLLESGGLKSPKRPKKITRSFLWLFWMSRYIYTVSLKI